MFWNTDVEHTGMYTVCIAIDQKNKGHLEAFVLLLYSSTPELYGRVSCTECTCAYIAVVSPVLEHDK